MNAKAIGGAVGAALVAALAFGSYLNATHIEHKRIFVENKERLLHVSSDKNGSTSSYQNFVYASDETYVVEDSLWNGHFRAGTVYAQVHDHAFCDVTLAGQRIGFLSLYQNIIAVSCDGRQAKSEGAP